MNSLAVVIPCLNDLESIRVLVGKLSALPLAGQLSIVVVDDGSTPPVLGQLRADPAEAAVTVLTLKRNVGHQRAIAIGLAYAVVNDIADTVAVMDGDGEDRPEDLVRLVNLSVEKGPFGIVVAERTERSEGVLFRAFYAIYRALFYIATGLGIRFGNFSAMHVAAARRLSEMGELWISLPATVLRSRLAVHKLATSRGRRYFGASQMNLTSLIVHGFGAIAVFYDRALTRLFVGGLLLIGLAALASVLSVILKVFGLASPGWVSTVIGISLVILVTTAIVCFMNIIAAIVGGTHAAPPPSETFSRYIQQVDEVRAPARESSPVRLPT